MMSEVKIGKRGYAVLVDASGNIMAHPRNQELIGKSFTELGISELKTQTDLVPKELITQLVDGKKYHIEILSGQNPYTALYYIAIVEESEYYDSAKSLFIKIALLTLLLLLTGLLTSYWISGILASPLLLLGKAADEIASGNLDKRIELNRDDDVGELANRFNKMTEALQQAQQHLEDMVTARTLALSHANTDLINVNQELQSTILLLEQTQDQLVQSEKLAGLGTLVAGVAHEINTPIGVAVTACSFVQEQNEQFHIKYQNGQLSRSAMEDYLQKSDEALQMVMRNLERASSLIHSFKQVAVDQSIELSRTIPIKTYLDEIFITLGPKLMQSKIDVRINCDPDLKIHTYPSAVFQIITNFVMNTLLHGYDPDAIGLIELSITTHKSEWVITYSDHGKGMPAEVTARVFDPFFTTKRNNGGTGLGLHIVYNIVTMQLSGKINCESTLGKGTRFTITMPYMTEDQNQQLA